ncbi:probable aspartic protease At2g35615 [Tripterygium wilfordii]|uniref:probable aspartic protease At2g35615 n=1 Tax=Tripterygium wilfordii TaxID=458696 RepID=UPI0018F80E31|nr:probable aspartic protease At2g35615 [Tripterygium wilfordii]
MPFEKLFQLPPKLHVDSNTASICLSIYLKKMHHQIFLLIFLSFNVLIQSPVEPKGNSFTIDLIHPDSVLSPFYNHSITPSELTRKAGARSLHRVNYFNSSGYVNAKNIESPVVGDGADYLVEIYVSPTQKQKVYVVIDTGSELTWIQCKPCENYNDKNMALYEPENSETYRALSDVDKICQDWMFTEPGRSKKCKYRYRYEKNAFTVGILSTETFYFQPTRDRPIFFPKLVFGCSHRNKVKFSSQVQGVIGLGSGQLSFVSQLGDRTDHKFSYCLVPRSEKAASKLSFGHQEKTSDKTVSTPFVFKDHKPHYYLSLEGVSVGNKKILIEEKQHNIIIDSGTPMTVLHSSIYDPMERELIKAIGPNPKKDPTGAFALCYDNWRDLSYPNLVFHFANADIRLKRKNTYIRYLDYICVTIIRYDGISIFGNSAQINFRVEYDLIEKQVSFTPTDCTKFGIKSPEGSRDDAPGGRLCCLKHRLCLDRQLGENLLSISVVPSSAPWQLGCTLSGLIKEGLTYFSQKKEVHEVEQILEHYACVADMICRAG